MEIIIDAKIIISNNKLDIPLENVKWGALIKDTYDDITDSVGLLTLNALISMECETFEY